MRLTGKSAIVTGGAKGIGKETALAFVREGARVLVTDLDVVAGEQTKSELTEFGDAEFMKVDVTNRAQVIVYALVNRQYMMDIQKDRSLIKSLLEQGLDIYIVDWGYPGPEDRYLTMDNYINGYVNNAVDFVLQNTGKKQLNLIGVCQGGTFSTIYTALHKQKIKNLVTMVTPIDFDVDDGLLFVWGKHLNIDNIVDTFGVVPGSFMNVGYNMFKPFQLMLDKYVGLLNNMDHPEVVENFVRMEKWI